MISKEIIIQKLRNLEAQHGITILYAVESGSRAWGFDSNDSDYDVRFIFKYNDPRRYYSLFDKKEFGDVILYKIDPEYEDLLDIEGWNITKVLKLAGNGNSAIFEWLMSNIVYIKDDNFIKEIYKVFNLKEILPKSVQNFIILHYLGLKTQCLGENLEFSSIKTIRIKKLMYAIRAVLAAKWIIDKQTIPPINIFKLIANNSLSFFQSEEFSFLSKLINTKRETLEKFEIYLPEFRAMFEQNPISSAKFISYMDGILDDINRYCETFQVEDKEGFDKTSVDSFYLNLSGLKEL